MKHALGNFHRITSVKALKDHLKPVIIPEMPNEKMMGQAARNLIWICDGITSFAKYASRGEKRQYVLVLLEEWRITALRNRWFCVRFLKTSPSIGEELAAVLNCLSREHKELKEATAAVCWYLDRNNVDDLLAAM